MDDRGRIPSRHPATSQEELHNRIKQLTQPHVESFNYFLKQGLPASVDDIPAREIVLGPTGAAAAKALAAAEAAGDPPPPPPKIMRVWIEDAVVAHPTHPSRPGAAVSVESRMFPFMAREMGETYAAPFNVTLCWAVGDAEPQRIQLSAGHLPIMVGSNHCHLHGLSPKELVERNEEPTEAGGYFICNGNERVIRMLQVPRRNYPMAVERSAFTKRGPTYSTKGVSIRCVRPDQSSISLTLHYLTDGTARIRFSMRKNEFFLPVMLVFKSLVDVSDREVYEAIMGGDGGNAALSDAVVLLQRDFRALGLKSRAACLEFLGTRFRAVLDMPPSLTHVQAGQLLLDRFIFVHLGTDGPAKFDLLTIMVRKLYGFVEGEVMEDNADALMNQEMLLAGHLFTMFIKERLAEYLVGIEAVYKRVYRTGKIPADVTEPSFFRKACAQQGSIGTKAYYLLATGNLVSPTGLDLMQTSGFTVVADKINYMRFITHFRSIHRGQFFTTMKTTSVRKLLPESWGFMCPVHTPDGSPCGLLNHMAFNAGVVTHPVTTTDHLPALLASLGMTPVVSPHGTLPSGHLVVMLDGKVIGSAPPDEARRIAAALRRLKTAYTPAARSSTDVEVTRFVADAATGETSKEASTDSPPSDFVPPSLEVGFIPPPARVATTAGGSDSLTGPFPGLFLATQPARLIRPVRQVDTGLVELVGPLEQVHMEIAATADDVADILGLEGDEESKHHTYSHVEVSNMAMLSLAAALTPFSDLNQSPRNMYQCQMGKQTLGTPLHTYAHRTDTKLYRLQTPQVPIVQNDAQRMYGMDEYPSGTNAIVAVISYTGFDMEDAMIINKGSYERGFAHASVYKSKLVDLNSDNLSTVQMRFTNYRLGPGTGGAGAGAGAGAGGRGASRLKKKGRGAGAAVVATKICPTLTDDGLPPVGLRLECGDIMYCAVDPVTGRVKQGKHTELEPAYVDEVRLLGKTNASLPLQRVIIKLRFNRNPVVGDKFSSRHGQKGVLSMLWPQEDMPFSESGMTPDIIINPHAFPSRMTIGMLIESMAGKVGTRQGRFQDSTPFRFTDNHQVVDYFGEQLANSGYSYYGSEPLYSGTNGTELRADIFLGVVYYQRLRHMVSDKSQVRSTGPINQLTRQPVKGRKNHGGIRFGEMERDSLLAHGTAFLLRDRLLNCSDRHLAMVCRRCGSMLSTVTATDSSLPGSGGGGAAAGGGAAGGAAAGGAATTEARKPYCLSCDTGSDVAKIVVPYVFRYLVNELAGMNIRLTLEVASSAK